MTYPKICDYDGVGEPPPKISFPEFHISPPRLGEFLSFSRIARVSGAFVKTGIWWWCHGRGRVLCRDRNDVELIYKKSDNNDFLFLAEHISIKLDGIMESLRYDWKNTL